ncbi:MAG TPA: ATP-binding protein [Methylomirabilota bacterium]|jgi:two-component system phosphate regulon sensor histidine kinase PhoR|nr:ATP-binding protein [Methylomirabilota bacterium]
MRLLEFLRRRIAIKLTLTLVGFVGVASLVAGLYLNRALEALAVGSVEARLATAARLLHDEARMRAARGASTGEIHAFVTRAAQATDARVTLIAMDGRVLGESGLSLADLSRMENHADRPEVRAARAGQLGHDLRQSATLHAPLLYTALPVRDRGRVIAVLRLALPLSVVTASHAAVHRVMLAGGLVALAVAAGIGLFVARRVTRPVVEMQEIARQMTEGAFDVRVPVRSVDEIGTLGRALNAMTARLRDKIEDLEYEQAKVTAILDGMVEGVVAVDGRDHIVLMNERARGMFDARPGRAEGKPFLEVVRDAGLHEIFREARRAVPGAVIGRELRLAGVGERVAQVNAVPLRLGGEAGIVMVLHDVTELRRLEQVRTEFVANVSHELRTPLTAIQGYVETLLGGALDERKNARKFLEIVAHHSERLSRLVNDLTDLSNIELGKVSLKIEPTRLGEVTESVMAIVRPRAASRRLTLTTHIGPDVPAVLVDRDRLAQILINLVDNAVKYTSEDGQVTIAARPVGDGKIEVSVVDTGVGIPRADLPRITERFYRVDKARSRELGGTGLGLAIVKHLVMAHRGELAIESVEGRGTTVRFTLPSATKG